MNRHHLGLGGYTIHQMQNQTDSQMTGYVIACPDGGAVVVDGGVREAAPRLRQLLWEAGGHVRLWLLTHFHHDHVSAPLEILAHPDGLRIDRVCALPVPAALRQPGFETSDPLAERFASLGLTEEAADGRPALLRADAGLTVTAGGLEIECLNDPLRIVREPWLDVQDFHVNDSSAVYLVRFPNGRTALCPGDIGPVLSGRLADELGGRLRADVCQMSHHGQNGACERFYACVRPSFCFWDAPDWLWDNDAGQGFGTGPWKTLAVRAWMAKLGVIRHAAQAFGENLLD